MALIEVVLLAGPAFAVGARRQSRNLALLAASGGTPRQARRVVLASGLVLGSLGAALGVLLGIGVAAAILPVLQRFSGSWFGPFDVPWPHLARHRRVRAALRLPRGRRARLDRLPPGRRRRARRSTRRPPGRCPRRRFSACSCWASAYVGSTYGALRSGGGEILIAASAIPAILGMILLIPLVLTGLARASRRLPLTLRYAVRDAARHRTRTVPAVAAVAATVAGVVALGVANASDGAQSRETYSPRLPMGQASLTSFPPGRADWDQMAALVDRQLPGARTTTIVGIPDRTQGVRLHRSRQRPAAERLPLVPRVTRAGQRRRPPDAVRRLRPGAGGVGRGDARAGRRGRLHLDGGRGGHRDDRGPEVGRPGETRASRQDRRAGALPPVRRGDRRRTGRGVDRHPARSWVSRRSPWPSWSPGPRSRRTRRPTSTRRWRRCHATPSSTSSAATPPMTRR